MNQRGSAADMKRCVHAGGVSIDYTLSKKRVKNLNLRVRPDGSVTLSAPAYISAAKADAFVKSRIPFILAARKKYQNSPRLLTAEPEYLPGDLFYYLGEPWRVQVHAAGAGKERVERQGQILHLFVSDPHERQRRCALAERWLREQARAYFETLSARVWQVFAPLGVPRATIRVRKMKSTWGNCRPLTGIITLNTKLLHAPAVAIEYVMVHEYAHLIHPNHSADFYHLVEVILPDYRQRKQLLRQFG